MMIRPGIRVLLFLMLPLAALAGAASSVAPASAATVIVSTCNTTSLGNAIASAASGDTITFDCSGTISATSFSTYLYYINKNLTIDGTGQNVTLDGAGLTSLFDLGDNITFTLKGLTIVNGAGGTYAACIECDTSDYAGAITQQGGTLNIINSTFNNNQTEGLIGGGAILSVLGTLNISNSTFSNNYAYKQGGAVFALVSTVSISNSTFSNNLTHTLGGAVYIDSGPATISGSTFTGNVADAFAASGGGGAVGNNGDTTIINSTFSGNRAVYGGAITNSRTLNVIHSTLRGNDADYWGNGIYTGGKSSIYPCCGGTTTITNTLLANADVPTRGSSFDLPNGSNCSGVNAVVNGGGNIADDDRCGVTQVATADLKLGSLANNGGPTQTIALQSGSAAINKVTCLASATTDQRGHTRPATGQTTCDIGAYEAGAVSPIQTTTLSSISGAGVYQGTATLTAKLAVGGTGVAGKSITFKLNGTSVGSATTGSGGVATLSGVSLSGIVGGSHPGAINASFAGDGTHTASSGSGTLTVSQLAAAIALDAATLSQTYDGSPRVVTATTIPPGLNYSVSYAGSPTSPTNAGTYPVVATITDPSYSGSISGTLTVNKADQTITVGTPPPASATYGTSFTVGATSNSGLPISYTGTGACSNSDTTFTMTSGSGTCTVTLTRAGNNNVNAAPSIVLTVAANTAQQSISFTSTAPGNAVYGDIYTPTATGGASGNPVTFSTSGDCAYDNVTGEVIMTGVGSCTVTANQAGNSNYAAAEPVTQSFSVGKASLSVDANDATMLFGGAVPDLGATVTGLANGDSFATLGGSCTAEVDGSPVTSSTPTGIYPAAITCAGVSTTNYIVSYSPGTLTIVEPPEITSPAADTFTVGVAATYSITASGFPAVTFSTNDQLPNGVSLSSDGVLSGTASTGTDGIHSFEIVATNGIDPDARQTFTLTILVPEIIAPDNMTVPNDTGFAGAIVNYPAPGTIGEVGVVTCTLESGSFFDLGTTTVTCVSSLTPATDSFTITVEDTIPPTIVAPANIILPATDPNGIVVTYPAPVVTDNAPGATAVCTPPSGSIFLIGVTTVTCTATDSSGNTASVEFTVSVLEADELLDRLDAQILATMPPSYYRSQLQSILDQALLWESRGNDQRAMMHIDQLIARIAMYRGVVIPTALADEFLVQAGQIKQALAKDVPRQIRP